LIVGAAAILGSLFGKSENREQANATNLETIARNSDEQVKELKVLNAPTDFTVPQIGQINYDGFGETLFADGRR